MKVLLLSKFDGGGAGRATYRLHQGLCRSGIDSQMLVQIQSTNDRTVLTPQTKLEKGIAKLGLISHLDALPLRLYSEREPVLYSLHWIPDRIAPQINQLKSDIVNLHWIGQGYVQIETLAKIKQPLVWTLHDMWAFTGGCHYSQNCDRYTDSCGACPQLHSNKNWDLSRWVWQRKAKAWKNLNLTLVTPSLWLAKCVNSSPIFHNLRVEVIPNGIDTETYQPVNKQVARKILNLPQDKKLILFGAFWGTKEIRKGFHLLEPGLQTLIEWGWQDQLELVIFGSSRLENSSQFRVKAHYLGSLKDDFSLALVYSAADVFVLPSTQDNLPNTVMEALACGTPCVAFNIGGMSDMIEHQQNGYLAKPFDIEELAQGIAWVLENQERHQKLGDRAREKADQEFTLALQAQRYLSLFTEILHH